jgi:cytidylate kinase
MTAAAAAAGDPSAVVTIAALYGAGGDVIGPKVAERLGVEFLDRAIPAYVAEKIGITEQEAAALDERPRSGIDRLIANLARVANPAAATGLSVERIDLEERKLRGEIEEFLVRAARLGGVVLGRGGQVVLRDIPSALHVYLGGPLEARIEANMEHERTSREEAERRVDANDRARREYVQSAYGVDGDDPSLYHLMIDATSVGVDGCVDLIVAASRLRVEQARFRVETS